MKEEISGARIERTRKLREEAQARKNKLERKRREELDEKKRTASSLRRLSQVNIPPFPESAVRPATKALLAHERI
jgi:uncharacterized membrane protein